MAIERFAVRVGGPARHDPIPCLQIDQVEGAGAGQGLLPWFHAQQAGIVFDRYLHGGAGIILDGDHAAAHGLDCAQKGYGLGGGCGGTAVLGLDRRGQAGKGQQGCTQEGCA